MRTTDMADELFSGATQPLPAGVRLATARHGGVTVTRVEIAREGLSRPRGRYVTLEMPSVSVLDERDAAVIEVCARELRALLPPEGPVLVLGVFMLKNVGELKNPKLDLPSVVLSTIAFGGLLYGFSSASSMGWGNPVVLGSIVAGVVCLVLFVVRQGKIEDPLLQLGTLKTREFRVAAIIVTLINAACLVTNTLLPLLLQTSLGASAFETGMAMLPAAAVGIIISPISGVVFDKFGPRAISIVGLALMTGALFLLSLSTVNTPILVVALFCMLQSAGQSLANMPVNTWGVNALKNDMIAHGNAIANTGRQVAGGLCTALIITVMTSVTASAGVDASIQVATAVGAGVAYKVCAAIGLVSLICAIFSVRTKKTAPKTKEA